MGGLMFEPGGERRLAAIFARERVFRGERVQLSADRPKTLVLR